MRNKTIQYGISVIFSAFLLIGCATTEYTSIPDPVGPSHYKPHPHQEGSLIVYTRSSGAFYSDFLIHSPYEIYTKEGVLFKKIPNHVGNFDPDPDEVSLPAGEYKIKARSKKDGMIMANVFILPSKTTFLDLNDEIQDRFEKVPSNQLIKTPSGHIIGFK
ncbi:MAG: hypothetical protein V4507_12700, partial [Verrucomicrobiota bacterium]